MTVRIVLHSEACLALHHTCQFWFSGEHKGIVAAVCCSNNVHTLHKAPYCRGPWLLVSWTWNLLRCSDCKQAYVSCTCVSKIQEFDWNFQFKIAFEARLFSAMLSLVVKGVDPLKGQNIVYPEDKHSLILLGSICKKSHQLGQEVITEKKERGIQCGVRCCC